MRFLQCGVRRLDLSRPVVMGILNVTPDSFSDGGRFQDVEAALAHARHMVEAGARLIDIGAESTRPGASPVSVQEEMDRLLPVLERLVAELDVVVSLDTSTPEVMAAGAARGAGFLNDVRALRRPGALAAAAATGLPVCLMHMKGEPGVMQAAPGYGDVCAEVEDFLIERVAACRKAGIGDDRIVLDQGFGFGKSLSHNLDLMAAIPRFAALGYPLLVGVSRKSMLGALLGGAPVEQRLHAGVAAAAIAAAGGARIIRTHDVKATCDALAVAQALLERA